MHGTTHVNRYAVPVQKYLRERRSHVFSHDYTTPIAGFFKDQFTTAQVGGGPTPQARGSRRGAEGVWGGGVPSPEKKFDFGSQYGEFWCILDGIFYSSATCFTRKTGVIWCP